MPLKIIPPRKGKSPNYSIRGTYLGQYVDQTSGTDRRSVAVKQLKDIETKIELGEWDKAQTEDRPLATFALAALRYLETGHKAKHIAKLVKYFGDTPLTDFNQDTIDDGAVALFPNVLPATRNRAFYTPLSAVLHHAGITIKIRRPKDSKGREITDALSPEDAGAIIAAAQSFDPEYALLLKFLLYTGVRLGEALRLTWDDIRFGEKAAMVRFTKNGDPRPLLLRDDLCVALMAHSRTTNRERVFRFQQGGWLKLQLLRAKLTALGILMPVRPKKGEKFRTPPHRLKWVNHHTFRHTWATWMRRYGGADEIGLSQTGNWRDPRSVRRYVHAVTRDEWQRVEKLPAIRGKSVENKANDG
jgi:integrase